MYLVLHLIDIQIAYFLNYYAQICVCTYISNSLSIQLAVEFLDCLITLCFTFRGQLQSIFKENSQSHQRYVSVSISSYPCCITNFFFFFISNSNNLNFFIFLLVNLIQCLSFERRKLEFHYFYQFLVFYSINLMISFFWFQASFYFYSFLSWMVTLLI